MAVAGTDRIWPFDPGQIVSKIAFGLRSWLALLDSDRDLTFIYLGQLESDYVI